MSSIKLISGTNSYSVLAPPGSIMQFFDTTDPDGWLICDGVTRTASDGRYAALAPILNRILGVGTNTSNSCTPPDLKSKFLYGSSSTGSIGTISGSSTKTLVIGNLPAHSHGVTDPGHNHGGLTGQHSHGFSDPGHNHGVNDPGHTHLSSDNYAAYVGGGNVVGRVQWRSEFYNEGNNLSAEAEPRATTGITLNGAYTGGSVQNNAATIPSGGTGITTQNTGSGSAFDIMPPYITINYIMKF